MVSASLVAEHQLHRHLRDSIGFVQIYGLDGLRIRPPFEQPRLDGSGRRLDLQVGSTKRALRSVAGHEDDVVVPPDAQVDRALRDLALKWSEPFAHMLRLRQYIEDECDRSLELSSGDNLEFVREFDDCRPMPIRFHCCSPCRWSSVR